MSGDSSWLVNFHNISSGIRKNGVLQKMCNNNSGKIMHSSPDEVEVVREKKSKKMKKLHIMQDNTTNTYRNLKRFWSVR